MKRTKRIALLLLLDLCAAFLSGCPGTGSTGTKSGTDFYNLDAQGFYANYKQDPVSDWGKKAAVYQDQIFYSDPTGGGIFVMNTDGSQSQLAIECPDIRKLQFT